jgi:hypothetical protein
MNAAIGKLLTQFDANGRVKSAERPMVQEPTARPKEHRPQPQAPHPQFHRQPEPQSQAPKADTPSVNLLDDAYRRGHAAGLAEGETRLAEERVRSAIRLGEERSKWSDQQAVAIVNGVTAACREIETNIASSVARILLPFLADAVRDKAIEALVEQIAALTSNSSEPAFRVTGPSDLIDLVKVQLDAANRSGIEYQAADTAEVRVVADQTTIETQISTWVDRLKEARR